jgi:hypothetical protein
MNCIIHRYTCEFADVGFLIQQQTRTEQILVRQRFKAHASMPT